MAERGRRSGRKWLLRLVRGVPIAVLGIAVVYRLASLVDGSLADLSAPVEAAGLAGISVTLLLVRWLISRPSTAAPAVSAPAVVRHAPTPAMVPAAVGAKRPLESNALAEYMNGRAELANLIADVEARSPAAPAAPVEPAAVAEPDESAMLAGNARTLTDAVEQIARASELIVRACELLCERAVSDRADRRALADAVMTLAQLVAPPMPVPA